MDLSLVGVKLSNLWSNKRHWTSEISLCVVWNDSFRFIDGLREILVIRRKNVVLRIKRSYISQRLKYVLWFSEILIFLSLSLREAFVRLMYIVKWKIHTKLRVMDKAISLWSSNASCKFLRARKSTILHAFYARVGAAIPVASTVSAPRPNGYMFSFIVALFFCFLCDS